MTIANLHIKNKIRRKPFAEGRRFDLLNKEYLHNAHYEKLMNIPEIAKKLKLSESYVRLKFQELGIKIMPESERKRLYVEYLKS